MFNNKKIDSEVLNSFGYLPEEASLLSQCSVLDICEYYGSLKMVPRDVTLSRLKKWLKVFNIEEYLNIKIKKLSKGNRQKIQFIISILHDPNFIILDEPFSGLDPVSISELEKVILDLKSQGKTIVFSSHIMSHVENICDDILLINKGETILYGNLKDIVSNYKINGNSVSSLNEIFIDKVGESHE